MVFLFCFCFWSPLHVFVGSCPWCLALSAIRVHGVSICWLMLFVVNHSLNFSSCHVPGELCIFKSEHIPQYVHGLRICDVSSNFDFKIFFFKNLRLEEAFASIVVIAQPLPPDGDPWNLSPVRQCQWWKPWNNFARMPPVCLERAWVALSA